MAKTAAKEVENEAENETEVKDEAEEESTQSTFEGMVGGAEAGEAETPDEMAEEIVSGQELAGYTEQPDFGSEDILIPRLRLGQGLTPEVLDNQAKVGQWILTGSEPVDTVAFLPLRFCRRRIRRSADDDRNIVCGSQGAVLGDGDPGGACKECLYAKWTTTSGGGRRPPACTFIYSYIGFSITHQSAVLLEFKRTALPAGKTLNTIVARNKIGTGKSAVELGSSRVTKNNRTYYVPVIRQAILTSEETADIKRKSMF